MGFLCGRNVGVFIRTAVPSAFETRSTWSMDDRGMHHELRVNARDFVGAGQPVDESVMLMDFVKDVIKHHAGTCEPLCSSLLMCNVLCA